MRITNNIIMRQLILDIHTAAGRLNQHQRQATTAKRIIVPSDDPVGASLAMSLRASVAHLEQAQRNGDQAEARLLASSQLLNDILLAIDNVKHLALRGSNDSLTASERKVLAVEVNQKLEQVLAKANGRSIDGYLFGGTQTTTLPFAATRDPNGLITAAAPNPLGIGGQANVRLVDGTAMVVNVAGSPVFFPTGGVNIFQLLVQVRDLLDTGSASDVAGTLENLDRALDQVRRASTDVGSRVTRIQELRGVADSHLLALKARLSQIEDADMAQVSVQFQQAQTVYEAALAAASRILRTNLLDFLR
jgi:flagellar hook-associated protein 3 FlgL